MLVGGGRGGVGGDSYVLSIKRRVEERQKEDG